MIFVKDLFNSNKSLNYRDLKNINIAYVLANFPSLSTTFGVPTSPILVIKTSPFCGYTL